MIENRREEGVVLILRFIVMTTLTAVVAAFLSMTSIQTKGSGYDIASHKALWLAEAGLQQVIYQLKNDANYRSNPTTVNGNLGSGSYSVSVSVNGSTYTPTSLGTVSVLNRKVIQSVVVTTIPEAFGYVIYADDNYRTSGATNLIVTGSVVSGAQAENFPTVDYTYYYNNAPPAQRITGNKTFSAGTYSGIWYITGNVTIQDSVTINGTIVTEDKISSTNKENVTINPTSPNPALIANNDITFKGSENIIINGLIYAGADGSGDFNLKDTKTVNINGTIVAGSDVDLRDSEDVTITYSSSIVTNPPPGFSGGGGSGATVAPQKDWNEIVPAV